MTEKRDRVLHELETKLQYQFRDRMLLEQALTHRSYVHENLSLEYRNNERMEFLGDAILGFCISDLLIRSHEHFTEGELSRVRASLVNERSLSAVAGMIHLGDYVRLGKGEEHSGGRTKTSILSDTLEAVVAAIYLDADFTHLMAWFSMFFVPLLENNPERFAHTDYKTTLQQITQKKFRAIPSYLLTGESGPDNCKVFEVRMTVGDIVTEGAGRTKKEAEQEAARKALSQIESNTEETEE